jgi:hypothetical protein
VPVPRLRAPAAFQILQTAYLAGGMTRQGTRELLAINTAAIIGDPNHSGTARIDFDRDCTGTRVKAVFD